VKVERTIAGLQADLHVTGIGRFFAAAFIGAWLVGWAAGEAFALWALVSGVRSFFKGEPPQPGNEGTGIAFALFLGAFLIVWLTFWTIGGIMAGRMFLQLLFGRDRILASHDGVEVVHSFGLFRTVERLPRGEIRRFYRPPNGTVLNAETTKGTRPLTTLGRPDELAELEAAFNAEFGFKPEPAAQAAAVEGALAKGWCEAMSLEHDAVLVKDPVARRKQAKIVWVLCAALGFVPIFLVATDAEHRNTPVIASFFIAGAAAAGWGAIRLSFGRDEWRLEKGRLILQRRHGHNRTQKFEVASLELIEDNSGDGGPTYMLRAIATGAPEPVNGYRKWKTYRTLHTQSDDPMEPRRFGAWLSTRCQLPFTDKTTVKAKAADLKELKQKLAESGRFGRLMLRIVERIAPTPPRS
jgi:hypothetical protein